MEPRFLSSAPQNHLICPICKSVLIDPVISTNCGHTFCRKCVESNRVCCLDNKVFSKFTIVPNVAIKDQLSELMVYCQYHFSKDGTEDEVGCKELIKFDEKSQHEELCEYGFVSCPYECDIDLRLRRHELNEHCLGCPSAASSGLISQRNGELMYGETSFSCDCRNEIDELRQQNSELISKVVELTEKIERLNNLQEAGFKRIETALENLSTNRLMRSSSINEMANNPGGATTIRRQRFPSNTSLADATLKIENWAMPFAFKCIGILKGHTKEINCLAMKEKFIITGGADCLIRVWDISLLVRGQIGTHGGKGCIAFLKAHATINCMVVKGDYLFSAADDKSLKKWNLSNRQLEKEKTNVHNEGFVSMAVAGQRLFCGSMSEVDIFNTEDLQREHVISGLHHWVRSLALNSHEDLLVGGAHGTIYLWDIQNNPKPANNRVINHSYGSAHSIAVTNQHVIVGSYNQNIQVFDLLNHTHLYNLHGHVGCVTALLVSPSNRWLFSASSDSTLQVWDLEAGLPVQSLSRHSGSVHALSLYGDLLFSVGEDTEIKVYKYFKIDNLR